MARRKKWLAARRRAIHDDLIQEWLGCSKPQDLKANISSAGQWIDEILQSRFFSESIDEENIKAVWKEIAGEFISQNTHPVSVKEGALVLQVTQPAMRFHLEQLRPELLAKVQAKLGHDKIRSLHFTLS